MLGILGLLTGWILLTPILVVFWLRLGLPYMEWMAPFAGIALSVPVLAFSTLAGISLIAWSVRSLAKRDDDLAPPH